MNKTKLIKRLTFIILIFALIITPFSFNIKNITAADTPITPYFKNQHFKHQLTDPLVQTEEFVTMGSVYQIIFAGINSTLNSSNTVKASKDLEMANEINTLTNGKKISIESALDLYKFGNSQSINFNSQQKTNPYIFTNTINKVLSLNYVLLADIDYSSMHAQKFVPIGTEIVLEDSVGGTDVEYVFEFTGSFDGNGFEISSLYLASLPYISVTFVDENESTAITTSTIKHYSMFANVGTNAVIKDFILRNPSYELNVIDDSADIFNFSYLLGNNKGTIENIAVIDKKTNTSGLDSSGIIFNMQYPSTLLAKGAGFVNINTGNINNSFFVGQNVVISTSMIRFNEVLPFVNNNTGTITNSSFQTGTITKPANAPTTIPNFSESDFKSGTNVNINQGNSKWHFYPEDGYPRLFGLNYVNNQYEINNEIDFLTFSKLLNLNTKTHNKFFNEHTYVIKNNLNLINFKGYKTPNKEFKGILKGGDTDFTNSSTTNTNKYITNLNISYPYIVGSNYYLGLFSSLSGEVKNINFLNNNIEITSSNSHYGKTFYIGGVTGELRNGVIKNVITENQIKLGTEPLGLTYVGGLAGFGKGTISFSSNNGKIDGQIHNFNNMNVNPNYYIGGLLGTNNGQISIKNSLNNGEIIGVGSTGSNYNATTNANTFTGGIVGEINNITSSTSELVYLTNNGIVKGNSFVGKSTITYANQYVGGLFGSVKGFGFKLNNQNDIYTGRLENNGVITGEYVNTNTYLYAAGITTFNTTESLANLSYVSNNKGFNITNFNYQNHNKNIFYAATLIDNTTNGVTLSRAYSNEHFTFSNTYFTAIAGLTNPTEIKIAPFFTSVKNAQSKLLYVENRGNLTIGNENNDITINQLLKVSNITQSTRVDYKNVTNSGNVNVLRINNATNSIYVSGVTWILPYVNRPYVMENVVNEGNIITAAIKGNTTIDGSVIGTSFADSEFYGNLNVRNLYVSGIVNLNVGEVKNSFNLGTITSTYNSSIKDINGTANTFVGGINTFNYNLIKDSANSGLIEYTNSSSSSVSYFAATTNISITNNSKFGGISISYTGGLVLGGISAGLGDISGTELTGHKQYSGNAPIAKVIDTANNGNIFGKAKEYVRSGGILGIALSVELASGTYENRSSGTITAGPFTTAVIGSGDPVGNSLLSNGLNFGNVTAITEKIGEYGDLVGTETQDDRYANSMRPGINAVAAGVISYGLTKMVRMLNHGTVSSTDVAGGIVGSTYILGGESQGTTPITTVEINTAVNYGKIKAAKKAYYTNFVYVENENYGNTDKYYPDGDTSFIFQGTGSLDKARYQNGRRGFGGIFGRLQRGRFGTMSSNEFKNILNMDSNIDMVGRVDSNIATSLVYYRFFTGVDTYYSAKVNDTTPNALVGWNNSINKTYQYQNATVNFTVRRSGNSYYVTNVEVVSPNTVVEVNRVVKTVMRPNQSTRTTANLTYYTKNFIGVTYTNSSGVLISNFNLNSSDVQGIPSGGSRVITINNYTYNPTVAITASGGTTSSPGGDDALKYPIRRVTDNPNEHSTLNIFDTDFSLMSSENSEYIYAVNEDALAARFKANGSNPKPYGMYVLASSTGSIDGAALPTNIKVSNLLKLNEGTMKYIDLNSVSSNDKVQGSASAINLFNKYQAMYQLSYNDKSDILAVNDSVTPKIGDIVFYDPTNNSPKLEGGEINHATKTITFNVNTTAFTSNNFNYQILSNELSSKAVIGKTNLSGISFQTFNQAYLNRVDNLVVDTLIKPTYSGSVASGSMASFVVRVYSEIFAMDQNIYNMNNKYFTDYTVIINRQNTSVSFNARINVDGAISNHNGFGNNINVTNQMNNTGTLIFDIIGANTNSNNSIPLGHKITFKNLKLGSEVIDSSYYTVSLKAKDTTDYFGLQITLNDELINGNYTIEYSMYNNTQTRTINFTKKPSTDSSILDIDYHYFSQDLAGNNPNFTKSDSTNLNTYIAFSYVFDNVTTQNSNLSILVVNKQVTNSYSNNVDKYVLSLGSLDILELKLAPFSSLTSASIKYYYNSFGLKIYELTYVISYGNNQSKTVIHNITERDIANSNVYLDDNLQTSNSFSISRESLISRVDYDFNFFDETLNSQINLMMYDGINVYDYTNEEISFGDNQEMYNLRILSNLGTGTKRYNFALNREGNIYILGDLHINKLKGTSAYLSDIRFGLENEAIYSYPSIKVTDNQMVVNNNFDPRIDNQGIDYVSTDEYGYNYFKIDGKVSDIILESYSPRFFLPAGATIYRKDQFGNYVTDLNADFVGEDGFEKVVTYKVVSEDLSSEVIYFVTAVDLKYNLTLRFEIYFEFNNGTIVSASDPQSPIKNNVVLISQKNMKLDTIYQTPDESIANYPDLNINNILGINNQSSLYYFVNNTDVTYRFGTNMTGLYNFNVVTPRYIGQTNNNSTSGERYNYKMYLMPSGSAGNQWHNELNKLPDMKNIDDSFTGLNYYIYNTTVNSIIRKLAIVIHESTRDTNWGLYDDYASFD